MALKKLLTNLEQGLTAYPNHNTPSDVGGFNYGQSTSIFDHKQFDQKSLRFGQGTAFDRPGGGFSNQPFQTNNITRELGFLLDNYGLLQKIPQGIDTVTDGFIRGGVLTHAKRLIQDTERIGRFLLTPKGLSFIVKQRQLQKTNPKIDEPSEGGFLSISHANQRTYNLGINTLASVASAGTGIRIKREGLLPTAHKGYDDSDSLFKNNKRNRLINLFDKHIERGSNASNLYSYSGGPDSLYGIGKTTIRKYKGDKKGGLLGDVGTNPVRFFRPGTSKAIIELDREILQEGYLKGIKVRPGDYDKDKGERPITLWENHIYDDTESGEGGGIYFPTTSNKKLDRLEIGYPHHGYLSPNFSYDKKSLPFPVSDLREGLDEIGPKSRGGFPHLAWTKDFFPLGSRKILNDHFWLGDLTYDYIRFGDKTLKNLGVKDGDKVNEIPRFIGGHFQPLNSHLKDPRPHTLFEPSLYSTDKVKNYLTKTKKVGSLYYEEAVGGIGKTYHIQSRINTGNPGARSSRNPVKDRDSYLTHTVKNTTIQDYGVYDSKRIDKINALDVFESGGNYSSALLRDLVRFRFEMVNNDKPGFYDTIVFRALLDNVDDNYAASHNTFKYNGRGEEFYTYNSFKRNINFSFKIAANSRHEMMPLYRKLNFLVANTAPDYGKTGRMRTPFTRLTIGSWMDRIPGVINSVNVKWQKDYPWEISISSPEGNIDKHMHVLPHVLDISVQFTPVHNFLPEKSIHSPFILPHSINRTLDPEQQWLKEGISPSVDNASVKDVRRRMGVEELNEVIDIPPTPPTTTKQEEPEEYISELDEDFFESPDATTGETPFVIPETIDVEEIDLEEEEEIIEDVVKNNTPNIPTTTPLPITPNRNITVVSQEVKGVYPVDGKLYDTQNANGDYRYEATYVDPYGNTVKAEGIGSNKNNNLARENAGRNARLQFANYYQEHPNYKTDPIKNPEVLREKSPIPQSPSY